MADKNKQVLEKIYNHIVSVFVLLQRLQQFGRV